jgi:thiol-disulfide isomerase/thioredoxin
MRLNGRIASTFGYTVLTGQRFRCTDGVGLCGSLLIITILSQKAIARIGLASDNRGWFKRTIGALFILVGIAIISGFDKKLELSISSNVFDVTKIEQKLLATQTSKNNLIPSGSGVVASDVSNKTEGNTLTGIKALSAEDRIKMKSLQYPKAPEIANPSGFVNTDGQPVTLAGFKGKKVVLVDFWTYSCINCQRTIPYLNAWYKKYADQGLEIVSIHTPEFAFEKVQSNVEGGVKRFGIEYPVVLDNDYGTWKAFSNEYWPREYLIDIDGFIVHDHAGEGEYDVTEQAIQKALAERSTVFGSGKVSSGIVSPADIITMDSSKISSPETYFGSGRNEYLSNGKQNTSGTQSLVLPQNISLNSLYLSGNWNFLPEYAETSDTNAKIIYKYNAKPGAFVQTIGLPLSVNFIGSLNVQVG